MEISSFPRYCKPFEGRANALGCFPLLYIGWQCEKHLTVFHHFISEADRNETVNFIFGTSFAIKWMVMPWLWLN